MHDVLSRWSRRLGALALLCLSALAVAQPLPATRPEDVGLSSERLNRIGSWLEGEVAANRIPGAVILVTRNGKTAYSRTSASSTRPSPTRCRATASSASTR